MIHKIVKGRRRLPCPITFLLLIATESLSIQYLSAQGVTASNLLTQLSSAFSGGQIVQQVSLSGNASWYAGSLEDAGPIMLEAAIDGSSQVQLNLGTLGLKTETKAGAGSSSICQWSGSDAILHDVSSGCQRRLKFPHFAG